jgi:hypothetical protein
MTISFARPPVRACSHPAHRWLYVPYTLSHEHLFAPRGHRIEGAIRSRSNAKGQILPEGDAYAPWGLWNDLSLQGAPLALVAAAVLAANPHDTQPWLFRISDDAIEVLADLSRNLGAMDAFVREMHLGLGCAIENMLVAAGPNGYDAEVATVEGSLANFTERRSPVAGASVRLKKRAPSAPDGFYRAIALRHTNRYAYERNKAVPADWREFLRRTGDDQGARVILFDEGEDRRGFDAAVVERPRLSSMTRQ